MSDDYEQFIACRDDPKYRKRLIRWHTVDTISVQLFFMRDTRNWSVKHLAELSGLSVTRIRQLEGAEGPEIELPTGEELLKIANAFGIAISMQFNSINELVQNSRKNPLTESLIAAIKSSNSPANNS